MCPRCVRNTASLRNLFFRVVFVIHYGVYFHFPKSTDTTRSTGSPRGRSIQLQLYITKHIRAQSWSNYLINSRHCLVLWRFHYDPSGVSAVTYLTKFHFCLYALHTRLSNPRSIWSQRQCTSIEAREWYNAANCTSLFLLYGYEKFEHVTQQDPFQVSLSWFPRLSTSLFDFAPWWITELDTQTSGFVTHRGQKSWKYSQDPMGQQWGHPVRCNLRSASFRYPGWLYDDARTTQRAIADTRTPLWYLLG